MNPLDRRRAVQFWRGVAAEVKASRRALLISQDEEGIRGIVQLLLKIRGTSLTVQMWQRCWFIAAHSA